MILRYVSASVSSLDLDIDIVPGRARLSLLSSQSEYKSESESCQFIDIPINVIFIIILPDNYGEVLVGHET